MCIYLGRYTHIYFLFLLRNPGSSDTTIETSTPSAKIWFLIPFSNQKKLPGDMTEFSSGSRKIQNEPRAFYRTRNEEIAQKLNNDNRWCKSKGYWSQLGGVPNGQSWNKINNVILNYSTKYKINILESILKTTKWLNNQKVGEMGQISFME